MEGNIFDTDHEISKEKKLGKDFERESDEKTQEVDGGHL